MTASPAKFTFDVNMDQQRERTSVLTEDEIAALTEKARLEGVAAGRREYEESEPARISQAILAAAERVAQQSAIMAGARDQIQKITLTESVHLALSVGRKLAGQMMAKYPTSELETLINECLASIDHAPHLVIRCHPDLADQIQETAENNMATSGFSGRLVVMGDPDIPLADGRIEWADGGLVRDQNDISDQIDKCIGDYLAAHGAPTAEETKQ
jgi:flagellar assembly protein FliH